MKLQENRVFLGDGSSWMKYASCGLLTSMLCFTSPAIAGVHVEKANSAQSVSQTKAITGNVVDEQGNPIIGASVMIKGTSTGAVTDIDGNFNIPKVEAGTTLEISYIGYKTQSVKIGNQSSISVKMLPEDQQIDEIVVVGYGVVKKSDLTGSVGSVKSETIAKKGSTSVMESLQGQVAGVNISQSSSRAGDGFNIQIRGKSSMNDDSKPLYVIDGVVCDNMDFLNPMDIEKVDVLKDASSTAIYGSRATNGVVMITTKKGDSSAAKTTVSYDGYYGFKTTANMPEFMSGDEFLKYRFSRYLTESINTATGVSSWEMKASDLTKFWCNDSPVIKQMFTDKNYTDWTDLVTRDGSQQNHFVNISGNAKT